MGEETPSDTGAAFRLSRPAREGNLVISGGIGGFSFQLEELASGSARLDDLASRLGAVEGDAWRVWQELAQFQNEPRSTGTAALLAVGAADEALRAVRTELQGISSRVRQCMHDYEAAEARSRTFRSLGMWSPAGELEKHADFWRTGFLNRNAAEMLVGDSVAALAALKSLVEGGIPGLRPEPLDVRQEESVPISLEASPAGLLERIRLIEQRGSGYIEVVEVDQDGRKAYVVVIPGTQMAEEDSGRNPFDLGGIADGLGSNSAAVNAAVVQALQSAGAEPGSPVVAAGYSQGGIHAMNLAADQQFRSEYDMKYVVTAGSPVGRITPPPDVNTLHLEHRTDWVPGSDGSPNADTANQVTVTMTNDLHVQVGEDVGLGPGHSFEGYQEAARLVAGSSDPSLVHSTAVLAGVLGAGGTATATRYSLSRTRGPTPTLTPQDPRAHERGHGGR